MKIYIKDFKKFIKATTILFFLIVAISFAISNISFSHKDTIYQSYYTVKGDTIWNIAKEQKQFNSYYQDFEIREIIYDIKKVNQLTNSALKENQELKIPTLK